MARIMPKVVKTRNNFFLFFKIRLLQFSLYDFFDQTIGHAFLANLIEVLCQYQRKIAHLHQVLLDGTAREFWIRSPGKKW
jgi:hypothetical protein